MRNNRVLLVLVVLLVSVTNAPSQILTVSEIADPLGQRLQARHMGELEKIASDVRAHHFPYPFCFSRQMGLDFKQQSQGDQRSIQFTRHEGKAVLEMTGNYYASYSAQRMDKNARVRQTFNDVLLPILQAAAPRFERDDSFAAFALEVSHHVRQNVMGFAAESTENVALVLPREAALQLVQAKNKEQQQSALLEGVFYVNAKPFLLWLMDAPPPPAEQERILQNALARQNGEQDDVVEKMRRQEGTASPAVSTHLVEPPEWLARKSRETVDPEALNRKYADTIAAIVRDLDAQAHLVAYAPPTFVDFNHAGYLQLSLTTPLEPGADGSQYKLAALAFDQHIAHLVRPVLKYLPADATFEGVDFSTTVKASGSEASQSVEFLFPVRAMRCFAAYECTGQQLINSAVVLINGERAALDLQRAEAGPAK